METDKFDPTMDPSIKSEPQYADNSISQNDNDVAVSATRQATPLFIAQNTSNTQSTFTQKQLQKQNKLKSILTKRNTQNINENTINLPFNIDENIKVDQQSLQKFQQEQALNISEISSVSSKLALPKAKFRKLNEERDFEYSELIKQFQQNNMDNLLEKLKTYEKQQERFQKQAFEKKQSEFNDETTDHFTFLYQQQEDTQRRFKEFTKQVIEELQHTHLSTQNLFGWLHNTTNINLADQNQKQNETAIRIKDIEQSIDISIETFDLLFQHLNKLENSQDCTTLDNKFTKGLESILNYNSTQVNTLYTHIQANAKAIDKCVSYLNTILEDNIQEYIQKYMTQFLESNILSNHIKQQFDSYSQRIANIEQMAKFSYFTSNVLIDQDHYLKQGLQESSSKQANMLDLLATTNNILKQYLPVESQNIVEKQFKDSVQSLNLDKKVALNFPNVQKIVEFMEAPAIDERQEAQLRANDPNRSTYQQNIQKFFDQYPSQTYLFMNESQQQQQNTSNQDNNQTSQANISQQQDTQNNYFNKILKSGYQVPLAQPTNFSFPKSSGIDITLSLPQQTQNAIPNLQSYDMAKQLSNHNTANQATNKYGVSYSQQLDQAKLYANFNFREKYNRNIHPRMFLTQFETVADQCMLTDQQRTTQFMFCLQYEYLDWYKARVAQSNYTITWLQLKTSFINTFQQDDDEVREELFQMYQSYGETPLQYLNRLRSKTTLSNLTDDDIKKQFSFGLLSQDAKNYISYMKQFGKQEYNNHTTTTLLQQLEKQARLQKYQLVIERPVKTWKKMLDIKNKNTSFSKPINKPFLKDKYVKPQSSKKVNFIQDQPIILSQQELQNDQNMQSTFQDQDSNENIQQDSLQNQENNDIQPQFDDPFSQLSEEQFTTFITNPSVQMQLLNLYNDMQQQDNNTQQTNVLIAGPSIPTSAIQNINNIQHQNEFINAGETKQVNFLNRKDQKNSTSYADKLIDISNRGKQLQKLDLKQYRKLQYIHLPEQQLLIQAPQQFLKAAQYLSECLNNEDNLLNTNIISKSLSKFIENIAVRIAELSDNTSSTNQVQDIQVNQLNNIIENNNLVISANNINYLLYINVQFQQQNIKALLDTGSTVTVISEAFCNKHKIQIPPCNTSKPVTLADGTICYLKEWKDTILKVDKYVSIKCDILIAKNTSYDMLFGLNCFNAIGCTLSLNFLRYNFIDDKKQEKFGKIELIKQNID